MSKTQITSPVAGFTGIGPAGLVFENGVAHTDDPAILNYLLGAGYGLDGAHRALTDNELDEATRRASFGQDDVGPDELLELRDRLASQDPEKVRAALLQAFDPRTLDAGGISRVGSALRDAAVDPRDSDFLAPTNAGKANPHGPLVVAPGIHADGQSPVRPGVVHVEDLAAQQAAETSQATKLLVDGQDIGTALPSFQPDTLDADGNVVPGDHAGPLGLSDPGSAETVDTGDGADEPATDPDGSPRFETGVSDPVDFTAKAVLEHLATADQAEQERVRTLEQSEAGKQRTTVLRAGS